MATAATKLALARTQFTRLGRAWDPLDWGILSMFGLLCLEAAVDAACLHFGHEVHETHRGRRASAQLLSNRHGLSDVSGLLGQLDAIRLGEAYGDMRELPVLNAKKVAIEIERYLAAVSGMVKPPETKRDA